MKYCKRCVMPDSKPDLRVDNEGICNACRAYENRTVINWDERELELKLILEKYRSPNKDQYDCIIPVSGGKDSTYQVLKMLEYGMTPLCVISTTCHLSDVGRENIENIKSLGVDLIEFSPNPVVRKKLNRIGLKEIGDISWPEHVGIFTIPIQVAVKYKIPLVIWGENSQNEYGGPAAAAENNVLTRRWLEEFGGMLGLRVSDLIGLDGISKKDLIPYTYPTDAELEDVGVTGLFLGHYIPWDDLRNFLIAQAFGFSAHPKAVTGSVASYANLDNYQAGIHDYFKYIKFGFGRASDFASMHIRRDRISRVDGVKMVKRNDGKFPWTYLGKSIVEILKPLDISLEEFVSICDRFTNKKIFKTDATGNLLKDKDGNLIKKDELK